MVFSGLIVYIIYVTFCVVGSCTKISVLNLLEGELINRIATFISLLCTSI